MVKREPPQGDRDASSQGKPPAWTGKGKADLIAALGSILKNFVLGMAVPDLVEDAAWSRLKDQMLLIFVKSRAPLKVPLSSLSEDMQDPERRIRLLEEFHKAHKRAALSESFELVASFCRETGQEKVFQGVSWYQFARIVRNAYSHSRGGFIEWPPCLAKKGITEVRWGNEVINSKMHGQEIRLGAKETYELLKDHVEFAKTALR